MYDVWSRCDRDRRHLVDFILCKEAKGQILQCRHFWPPVAYHLVPLRWTQSEQIELVGQIRAELRTRYGHCVSRVQSEELANGSRLDGCFPRQGRRVPRINVIVDYQIAGF